MLWLAAYDGLCTAHETDISFHFDDADDRCHDAERDGDSGEGHALRDVDRVAAAPRRRHPGGNIARRGAAAWHGMAGHTRGGFDFRPEERRARGRASWLKRIGRGNRPPTRTACNNSAA